MKPAPGDGRAVGYIGPSRNAAILRFGLLAGAGAALAAAVQPRTGVALIMLTLLLAVLAGVSSLWSP